MGKNSGAREARRARQTEEQRDDRIKHGSAAIRQMFDDKFNQQYYANALENQKKIYQPDFDQQFEGARKQLEAALMRAGLSNSSVGVDRTNDQTLEKNRRQADLDMRAQGDIDTRKNSVLQSEENVLGQLRSSGDVNAANASAAANMANQSAPIPYSPLGSVFTDATAGLATQADQERQGTNRYNLGVTNWGNNLRRYTSNIRG